MKTLKIVYAVIQVVECTGKEFVSAVYESPVEATESALDYIKRLEPESFFYVKPLTLYLTQV